MLCHWNEIGISTNQLKDYCCCCWSVSNSSHQPRTCHWPQEIFGRSRVFHCSETSIFWISSGKLGDHACNLLVVLFNMSSLPELNCFATKNRKLGVVWDPFNHLWVTIQQNTIDFAAGSFIPHVSIQPPEADIKPCHLQVSRCVCVKFGKTPTS